MDFVFFLILKWILNIFYDFHNSTFDFSQSSLTIFNIFVILEWICLIFLIFFFLIALMDFYDFRDFHNLQIELFDLKNFHDSIIDF